MNILDGFWHVLNFFLPAVSVGCLTAAMTKLLWRQTLKGVSWRRLATWGTAACTLSLLAGLILFGRDGKMATYGAMVLACAVGIGWAGFAGRRA